MIKSMILFVLLVGSVAAQEMKCPSRVFTDAEILDILEKQRTARSELPAKFDIYETTVMRHRCLYVVYERRYPTDSGVYQTFTVDPFGELMDFYVSK